MNRMYAVQVQHPCIELEGGKVIPNFKTIGTVMVSAGCTHEDALKAAQAVFADKHCPSLLTVEPLEK